MYIHHTLLFMNKKEQYIVRLSMIIINIAI